MAGPSDRQPEETEEAPSGSENEDDSPEVNIIRMMSMADENAMFEPSALVVNVLIAGNQSQTPKSYRALIDTGAQVPAVIDYRTAEDICRWFNVGLVSLQKPKTIRSYEGKRGQDITKGLYLPLQVKEHFCPGVFFFVTKLGSYDILLGNGWMAKPGAVIDCRKMKLDFIYPCKDHDNKTPWDGLTIQQQPKPPPILTIDPNLLGRNGKFAVTEPQPTKILRRNESFKLACIEPEDSKKESI